MNRAPRGVDLSFLNEEEAQQIFHVLERDSQLKRAEKERLSKLYKKKEDATELPGVTGEWFQEIQRRKFQNDSDVSRMFKQPLAHRLKKAIGNDSANPKPSGAQKHVSPSILGGLRTPFASLFSSFRKSKRQQHPKPQQQPQKYSPRYDHFVVGAHTSSKVEEMAKTETCDSPLPSEPTKECFEASQTEMMDDSSCTWNEQLENELLRVLGSLDDQLAREQSQDVVNRRTPTHFGSRSSETDHSAVTRHNFHGGIQRNERSMFLSGGTRTLRAKDEHKTFFRPRVFYDTYMKRRYTEDLTYGDGYDRKSPALKRGHSARSLGHSSEGSLQLPSGQQSSGFAYKGFRAKDTVSRSCSLSCLTRGESLTSIDELSPSRLHHPLGSNRGFAQKNYHHQTKRTPLSSIAWNIPQTSEHPLHEDRLLRTQSLMEFGPVFEDAAPSIPQENARYDFYTSKTDYGRAVPNATHSVFADKHTDSLYFDNRENCFLHQMKRNNWKPRYRYPPFHGRMNLSHKSFPSGRLEEQLYTPDNSQYYSDEVFLASDSNFEGFPTNVSDWQNLYAKKPGLWQQQWESDAQIHAWNMYHPEGIRDNFFSKHADGIQGHPTNNLSVPKSPEFVVQRQNLFTENAQIPSQTFVKHFQSKKNFKTHTIEEVRGHNQSGRVDSGYTKEETLRLFSGQMDRNNPSESQISPPTHYSVSVPSLSLRSPTKLTSLRNSENIYLSNRPNMKGKGNEDGCSIKHNLAHTHPSQLTAIGTRASIQSLPQMRHQPEKPKGVMQNKTSENTCSSFSRKGSEILVYNELPSSGTDNWHKHNRLAKHSSSNSITGSPSNSPPRSSKTYYTLPRKSASIDGSVVTEKSVSHPFRQVPYRNKIATLDNVEMLESNRIENIYSSKRQNIILLSPADSSLRPSSKEIVSKKIPQTQDSHLQLSPDPKHSFSDPSTIPSKSEKEDLVCGPDKTEMAVFPECEGKDAGNPLKQYKTTSTVTVSIEEDNVKYQELISVYYTLPRKYPRMLCNLFLDDTKNTDSSPPPGKSLSTEKKYEVRINVATVAFPSSLQKEEKTNLPTKMASTPSMQLNSNTSGDALNPTEGKMGASQLQSMAHHKEEAVGSPAETPELLLPNRMGSTGPLGDPKHSESEDESLHAITNTLGNPHIDSSHSQLKATENKISLGNQPTASSSVYVQKDVCCLASTEPPASTSPHTQPLHFIGNDQEGKCTAQQDFNSTMNSTEEKIREDIEVKEKACYVYHKISKKEFQPRSESVRSSTPNSLISETKVHSNFQNQTLQEDAFSSADSVLQPNRSRLDCSNTEEEPMSQNFLLHKVCTNTQRPVQSSAGNQNLNFKNQLTSTTKDLPDDSADENKVSSDCTKDKASDIEKRKNRSSIKNKLAAMYRTSRKFSSKKTMPPKPHISNIFSQNDAPFSEIDNPNSMLISSRIPQLPQQTGNENQNQNPLPRESEDTMLDKSENKKLQTNEGPPSFPSEIRRPFTNLCNQKWESLSPKQSSKKMGISQHSTVLFSKEIIPKVHNNLQGCDEGLKNNNQSTFSRVTVAVPNQNKKEDSNVAEPSVSLLPSNKNSNILITNYSKANICPLQEVISPKESGHHQNTKQTNRLRNLNPSCVETVLNPSKMQRERHFSECSYIREAHDHLLSGSNAMRPGGRYSRKFKSYSELLSCDENENWDAYDDSSTALGSRRMMYPSIEFGIFGKEQQQAFLDNIKKSLTEGRLWRPYLLNNQRSLKKEGFPLNRPEPLSSGFAKRNVSAEGESSKEPFGIYEEDPANYSESDSDTTTDDEYYLDENDKESEL